MEKSYTNLLKNAFNKYWDLPAFTDLDGATYAYKEVARGITHFHALFKTLGLQPADKVALCGTNSTHWAISFLAISTYGAIPVPIMKEWSCAQKEQIIDHSDAKMLIGSEVITSYLIGEEKLMHLLAIVDLDSLIPALLRCHKADNEDEDTRLTVVKNAWQIQTEKAFQSFSKAQFIGHIHTFHEEDLVILNYTSGTTSNPKGVMIPERALVSNILFAQQYQPRYKRSDAMLSFLPLGHIYTLTFGLIIEFMAGIHTYFLHKPLTDQYIMQAFRTVKPFLVITSSYYMERFVQLYMLPSLRDSSLTWMRQIPVLRHFINARIRRKLIKLLGGRVKVVSLGSSSLSREVDELLFSVKFPYAVGMGMTECAPIVSYSPAPEYRLGSCGKAAPNMEIKIDSEEPDRTPGEILVRGRNVMLGYYKNFAETRKAIDSDGWFHTGDMGILDPDGYLYLKGRIKAMFMAPNGLNIYPEAIEAEINSNQYIAESMVLQRQGKLVAMVYPNFNHSFVKNLADSPQLETFIKMQLTPINENLPDYQQLSDIEMLRNGFEKTPKGTIKRYLYQ